MRNGIRLWVFALALSTLAGGFGVALAREQSFNPEPATQGVTHERDLVRARHFMVSTANALATQAGYDMLVHGGSATDAAIASQLVLNVVEPQSSGIGGGGFMVVYEAQGQSLHTYDARETAPVAANERRFMNGSTPMLFRSAVNSGLSVGTPGLLRGLALMHKQHGKLPWKRLFQPAIELAEAGFAVSPRLHALLNKNAELRQQAAAASYFYDSDGKAWPVGYILKNPALAQVFRQIAQYGADVFYKGPIAQSIVDAVSRQPVPGDMALTDLSAYKAQERPAVCGPYYEFKICGMGPPSSGPLAIIQMLTILTHTPINAAAPNSLEAVHYFSEAGKLAYADRNYYVADPDFVDVPVAALLDASYLALRAGLISPYRAMQHALPGDPEANLAIRGRDTSYEIPSTTHISVVDGMGNVVSMTTSIESAFGSKILVHGFLLNNQLTDFSLSAMDDHGHLIANRVQSLKRPRSSMSPIIIFKHNKPYMAIGSPGGSSIINYVAKTIIGVLNWGLNIQQAIDLPNRGSQNRYTRLESGTSLHSLLPALTKLGHKVQEVDFPSGLQGIVITPEGLEGGADPRREGLVLGG